MKSLRLLLPVHLLLLPSMAFSADHGGRAAAEECLRTFVKAADAQDSARLEAVLSASFRVVFTMNQGEVTVLPRDAYIGLVRDGKIGGAQRKLRIKKLELVGKLAFARVSMTRKDARFEGLVILEHTPEGWRVIEDATRMNQEK